MGTVVPEGTGEPPRQLGRFLVSQTDGRLTLSATLRDRDFTSGCVWFAVAVLSLFSLGLLSIAQEEALSRGQTFPDSDGHFGLHSNHFSLLWLIALAAALTLVPITITRLFRSAPVYTFDRLSGVFARNNRPITTLPKIETICLRNLVDADDALEAPLYQLVIRYGDGFEYLLEESHDEGAMEALAGTVADFVQRGLVREVPSPGPHLR